MIFQVAILMLTTVMFVINANTWHNTGSSVSAFFCGLMLVCTIINIKPFI